MQQKNEILTQLKAIISEHLGVRLDDITEESTWAQLGADSLDRLEMSVAIEGSLNVNIPHSVGERLNTVGETVDHLLTLRLAPGDISNIQIESVTTNQQWNEMCSVRTQVFSTEYRFAFSPLSAPGETGVWHFLARNNHETIGTLSVVDTTGDYDVHQRYRLPFDENERAARYSQLAILKPYRSRGIFKMLIDMAQNAVIRPNKFAIGWLLYPATHARSSILIRDLGFTVEAPLLTTEFGSCHVLIRREASLQQLDWRGKSASSLGFAAAR